MAHSKNIGYINFCEKSLKKDISTISNFHFNTQYSEYFFGSWSSCPLWNKNGDSNDSMTYLYIGAAKETIYAEKIPYIKNLITTIFNLDLLKSARIFSMLNNSFSIPHRDFIEIEENYLRIHVPLQVGEKSYHSEENKVFKMKKGEIWFLNAADVHSAGYFSKKPRLHLVLDFEYKEKLKDVFKDKTFYIDNMQLTEILREKISKKYLNKLYSLSKVINDNTFFDVVQYLSKVHFTKDIPASQVFPWLYEIIQRSNHPHLLKKAEMLAESCLLKRTTGNLPNEFMR